MAGLVPALAGHVELQRERRLVGAGAAALGGGEVPARAAGPFERLDLADEDAVHQGAGRVGGVAAVGGEAVAGALELRGVRVAGAAGAWVGHAVAHRDGGEALVTGELLDREELSHQPIASWVGCGTDRAGAGDAAGGHHQLLQLRLVARRPLDLGRRLDERLEEHLAVTPVVQLVLEDELERADRGGVGDLARVVQVVRVRGDLVRDQHPVDADELLDRELGRFGLGHGVDEGHDLVVGRLGEAVGVHLPQLGQALVPQLGVPGVVVAVGAEAHLHVELGHGGHPAAERLEQLHLDPLVVADPAGRFLDVERAGQLAPVPWRERRSRLLRIGHLRTPRHRDRGQRKSTGRLDG